MLKTYTYFSVLYAVSLAGVSLIVRYDLRWRNVVLCLLLLTALHSLSLYNAFVSFLPAAEIDAWGFWRAASRAFDRGSAPPFFVGAQAYVNFLYWQIVATVNELHIVQMISVTCSIFSALLIVRLFLAIGGEPSGVWLVILMLCLSPSFLLYSPITLREPLQLLSVLLFLNLTLRLNSLWGVYLSASCLALAAMLHQALLIFCAAIVVLYSFAFVYLRYRSRSFFMLRMILFLSALPLFVFYFVNYVPVLSENTLADLSGRGVLEYLADYRRPIEEAAANTSHGLALSFDTLESTIRSLSLNYVYYLFGPIINFKPTIELVVLSWESLIRFAGIILLVVALLREKERAAHLLLAVFYVAMTFLWSLGTANDGQAFRHHLLSQWVLYIYIAKFTADRLSPRNSAKMQAEATAAT